MVAGMNRVRRVAALEGRERGQDGRNLPIVIAYIGESGGEAIARYVAEHGSPFEADRVRAVVFVSAENDRRAA